MPRASGLQLAADALALRVQDDVEVPDVATAGRLGRQPQRQAREPLPVAGGQPATRLGPGLEVLQLDAQDRALEGIHPVVESDLIVMIPPLLGVVPQRPQPGGDPVIVRDDRPALAARPEVLAGIKAEATAEPEGTGPPAQVPGAMGLRSILDDRDAVPLADL